MTPTTKAGSALLANLRVWTEVSPHWEGPEDEVWGYVVLDILAIEREAAAEAEALRAALEEAVGEAHCPTTSGGTEGKWCLNHDRPMADAGMCVMVKGWLAALATPAPAAPAEPVESCPRCSLVKGHTSRHQPEPER